MSEKNPNLNHALLILQSNWNVILTQLLVPSSTLNWIQRTLMEESRWRKGSNNISDYVEHGSEQNFSRRLRKIVVSLKNKLLTSIDHCDCRSLFVISSST